MESIEEREKKHTFYVDENPPSLFIEIAFGGSLVAFTIFVVLLFFGIYNYRNYDDYSLLFLCAFFLFASFEIYRENRNPTSTPSNTKVQFV